jgi:anthranilate phosphoribosyltransferase
MSGAAPADPGLSWADVIGRLMARQDLRSEDTAWAMHQILAGDATPAQIAGFAVALRAKGETVAEVDGLVGTMYEHATTIEVSGRLLDVVGTGGDRSRTVNISTMSAIVAAGAGAKVVKHGNRAASSQCGAADLLEELGVALELSAAQVAQVAETAGITFCFAPVFHPALRSAIGPRRELGVPTTFNLLGPLANPARPQAQAVGVADGRVAGLIAGVLAKRGVSALVFHGDDGLDELTTTATSQIWQVREGEVRTHVLDPVELGIPRATPEALRGADARFNAGVARALFDGERGPVRDAVLLNTAAALVAEDEAPAPLLGALAAGIERAAEAIDSGAAAAALDRWVTVTKELTAGLQGA